MPLASLGYMDITSKMLRSTLVLLSITCFVGLVAAETASDSTLERLLERYTQSYGGSRDASALASVSIQGEQVQQGKVYSFHLRKRRPAMLHYQLRQGDTTLTMGFDGQTGWLQTDQGGELNVEELSGATLQFLKREAQFESPLYQHAEKPANRITLEGREQVGGLNAYVLRVEEDGVLTGMYYLHPENARILRIDHFDGEGKIILQTLYRNYVEVEGYPFAHEVENRVDGDTVSLTRVHSISINPGLLSFLFEKPQY